MRLSMLGMFFGLLAVSLAAPHMSWPEARPWAVAATILMFVGLLLSALWE